MRKTVTFDTKLMFILSSGKLLWITKKYLLGSPDLFPLTRFFLSHVRSRDVNISSGEKDSRFPEDWLDNRVSIHRVIIANVPAEPVKVIIQLIYCHLPGKRQTFPSLTIHQEENKLAERFQPFTGKFLHVKQLYVKCQPIQRTHTDHTEHTEQNQLTFFLSTTTLFILSIREKHQNICS